MLRFMSENLREQYEKAQRLGKLAFAERPYFGSPGAPAQAKTNASQVWGHINAGYLVGYEYTRWWRESLALRQGAMLGDWSWLNKTRIAGPDAARFMDHATVKDLSRQSVGQAMFTPMTDDAGKVAVEGITLRLAEREFLFSQSAGLKWLEFLRRETGMDVTLEDVTPDYTCFALQGPRSTEILEKLTGRDWRSLRFSRFEEVEFQKAKTLIVRQGVTGEVGYELMMRTEGGRAHELWRRLREVGEPMGLREMGFKAQLIGHTETGIATVIRDYLPARGTPEQLKRMLRYWMPADELASLPWDPAEHFCSPAELGWAHTVSLQKAAFHGKKALMSSHPARRLMGLEWSSEDVAALYAAQFRDAPSAPPPDLPTGHFQPLYLRVTRDGRPAGWASGYAYSPTLRRMISLARLDRALAPGAEVVVHWGGQAGEASCPIRARVVQPPFIARNRERLLA